MSMQIQVNGLELCPNFDELENPCPLEMPLSQIMSFMHVCAKVKGAQHKLKGQSVLVPGDPSKVQRALP